MNPVDSSDHFEADTAASLLTIVLDTNPHAWALLEDTLPLSTAVANLLVFVNAHLACNYANKVAVVASHSQEARWLYPTPTTASSNTNQDEPADTDGDVAMSSTTGESPASNKYRPFRIVEEQLTRNLKALLATTSPASVSSATSTMMAGALTLALSHINRETIAYAETHGTSRLDSDPSNPTPTATGLPPPPGSHPDPTSQSSRSSPTGLQSRILIISVSSATGSAHQYIPIMNSIFACQRLHIPIDICKLSGDAVFLQQACDATRGIYVPVDHPRGFLQYLMVAFLPDQRSRRHLILPTRVDVDFRAACFCHRKVVDVGFVCSICLSIFCEPPEGADCLTCGTHLELGDYGAKPVVIAKKKKRKKGATKALVANGGSSGGATPISNPTSTPTLP
ncbi:RNA polymerase II transcription factor B subunit 4 [Coccidioides posadasii str. Silveira]|uniref:General transcription and DNA repair factor IIH subunit TFB4 n=2 Tax=Coccidioides posadasii TaxID=199306 RepID=E9D2A9_COCPS|nr:Transcription factor Tfb4 family protein [Coccidioides posadasii C735 delta SOWgp]EER24980.1 Transcription factor Tfb4 family protein [Coccidioides posadasii C735 delta SOWgp]EFW19323.1 transcription factor TFIIH subunit Tfb4 [Coccidioides posadasii str. Silveira]QVM12944.1 RNA polymerase II transcription factor B subunit 4 [Coccidioides posadasii str. Silveira]|eukprot:XP_003067125.1 Transcription factor Tfb4 family protein [Coccidioides posadasii C735 delta SOWgp]